jgi:hypothetical protein
MKFTETYKHKTTKPAMIWTESEYINEESKYPTLCEMIGTPKDQIKPYLDYDYSTEDKKELPTEEEEKEIQEYLEEKKKIFLE